MKNLATSLEIPLHQSVIEAWPISMAIQYYERALELASAITLIGKRKNSLTGHFANLNTTLRSLRRLCRWGRYAFATNHRQGHEPLCQSCNMTSLDRCGAYIKLSFRLTFENFFDFKIGSEYHYHSDEDQK